MRFLYLGVALWVLLIAFAFQGSRGLWMSSEPRYAECAREMLVTGDWLIPKLDGKRHLTKPPLTYWVTALGMELLGVNEWGARLGTAFAFVITVALIALIGRRLWGDAAACAAVIVYSTSLMPLVGAEIVTTDMLLTMWEALAAAAFVCALTSPSEVSRRRWLVLLWAAFGFAFLTKGPVGLMPLIPFAVFLWMAAPSRRGAFRQLFSPLGFVLFLVIGMSWYVIAIVRVPGLLSYFINEEIIGRAVEARHARNSSILLGLGIYALTLCGGSLPWSAAWPWLVRRGGKACGWSPRAFMKSLRGRPVALFFALWFTIPLVLFVIARAHLFLYVLPLFPPLALVTARLLQKLYEGAGPERRPASAGRRRGRPRPGLARALVPCLVLWGVGAVAAKACAPNVSTSWDSRALYHSIEPMLARGTSLYVLGNEPEYGLSFYSGQDVTYVLRPRARKPAKITDIDTNDFIARVHDSATGVHVIVGRKREMDRLRARLDKAGVLYKSRTLKFGQIVLRIVPEHDVVRTPVKRTPGTTAPEGVRQAPAAGLLIPTE